MAEMSSASKASTSRQIEENVAIDIEEEEDPVIEATMAEMSSASKASTGRQIEENVAIDIEEEEDPVIEATMADLSNAGEASTGRQNEENVTPEIVDDESDHGPPYENLDAWARSIETKCNGSAKSEERMIIPRVPPQHRQGNDDEAYEPRVISIGPYHRGKPRLQRMEKQKLICVKRIVDLSNRYSLVDYLREIAAMETQAMSCYSEKIDLKSKDFVEMMLMDGCFIVFYLLNSSNLQRQTDYQDPMVAEAPDIHYSTRPLNFPIWMHEEICSDLLLLENQLPFFVVVRIYSLFISKNPDLLMDRAHSFCSHVSPINSKDTNSEVLGSVKKDRVHPWLVHHLLHLYHWFLFSTKKVNRGSHTERGPTIPSVPNPSGIAVSDSTPSQNSYLRLFERSADWFLDRLLSRLSKFLSWLPSNSRPNLSHLKKEKCIIGTATFLEEAGIKFRKKKQVTSSVMDATFSNGVMEITPLFIDAFKVAQFRNLIALEKSDHYLEPQVIAFLRFMDYLISTSKDVALLRKKGILQHAFSSDEQVASIFNQLSGGTLEYQTTQLTGLYEDVDEYCRSKLHWWWATFMRDHFGSPWAAISLLGAVILLSLTFLQTFFSMYSYFRPPSAN